MCIRDRITAAHSTPRRQCETLRRGEGSEQEEARRVTARRKSKTRGEREKERKEEQRRESRRGKK
eukprot:2505822-Rhodomonas_salina.1